MIPSRRPEGRTIDSPRSEREPIRCIQIISGIDEQAAGTTYAVMRLSQELLARGERLRVVSLRGKGPSGKFPFIETYPRRRLAGRLGFSPQMRDRLIQASRNCDIFHSNGLWMMPNVYPGRAARGGSCKLVVSPHGMLSRWTLNHSVWKKRIFWALAQGPALRPTNCFHATALSEYENIRSAGFKQPVCVIPNGIDVPEMKPKPIGANRILLFLGRIHPIKGAETLLRAWAAVSRKFPEWELRIAGPDNGGYLAKIRSLAEDMRLERTVFCGPVYGEEKHAAYREAELFVLPTLSENFGLTVAESLAAATPVIVTKGAPWGELEARKAGRWIDIGVDPLVACLEETMSLSRGELKEMGARGREWMIADFSWPKIGAMMHETYEWLLHGGEAPAWVMLD